MDDLIQQGADALKSGDRESARKLLIAAVKQSPNNERAWGWMYEVCSTDQERIQCLKQMLRINPQNEKASALLNQLTKSGTPAQSPTNTTSTRNTQPQVSSLKKCPYCAEMIQESAIVCRFCGRDLTSSATPKQPVTTKAPVPPKKKSNTGVMLIVAIAAIGICTFLFAIWLLGSRSSTATPTSTPQESAWYACTLFIEKQLGVSTSKAQRYTASGVTTNAPDQYIVEVYYAELGDIYRCELLRHSNGDMELLSLKVK